MYVWDRFKSFDDNILKIVLKRQVICAAAAEYLCKKDKFWSEKCYLLQWFTFILELCTLV